ncbi:hypothetical protein BESB_003760 [Besnoitia besnoiti]|uniref:C2 domain-containing protein n=1 Tax=Besnoitia besnoiti TaxID=94643 RepID=A0A2A9MJ89_BESBE|nr:hypothetical protein BESB_003760 [Besnoitia besnoiti]PFH38035.1 hypothetical protein BESB_003760 [Besnoitia besnoiti]
MSQPRVQVFIRRGVDLPAMDSGKSSDPYVKFEYRGTHYRTGTVKKTVNPVWNHKFTFVYDKQFGPHSVTFEVWDANILLKDKKMGSVTVDLRTLEVDKVEDKYYALENAAQAKIGAALHIQLQLLPPLSETKPLGDGSQKIVVLTAEQARAAAHGRILVAPSNQGPVGSVGSPPLLHSYPSPVSVPPYVHPSNAVFPVAHPAPYSQQQVLLVTPPPAYPTQPGCFPPGAYGAPPPPAGGAPGWAWPAPSQAPPQGFHAAPPSPTPATTSVPSAASPQCPVAVATAERGSDGRGGGGGSPRGSGERSGDSDSSSDEGATKNSKKTSSRRKEKAAESTLIMEIKQIIPSATYGEVAKALIANNNDKDLALKDLVARMSVTSQKERATPSAPT